MKRFTHRMVVAVAVLSLGLYGASDAWAAAPTVTHTATTTLTTNGNDAITYTGYVNGESFQQDAITTFDGWQYAVFWDANKHVNISRRDLPSGAWQNITLTDYTSSATDSHNVISLGISSGDGTIHLAFDMHVNNLHYRRSITGLATNPSGHAWTASDFGAVQSQLDGPTITDLTYPQFIYAPGGRLQLAMRVGGAGDGNEWLWEYSAGVWTTIGEFIDGTSTSVNAYLFGIDYDNNGNLQTTWTWRATTGGSSNHDLMYAYSTDRGRTWRNNAGTVIGTSGKTFITPNSSGVKVWTIPENRGLMNQESQVIDNSGVVHVLASQMPNSDPDQSDFTTARASAVLVHYWRTTNGTWHQTFTPFLENSARGDIVADSDNNLYVASGDSVTHKLHIETASAASGWTDWTIRYTSSAVYFSDPLLDHELIKSENKLSIYAPRASSGQIDVQDWNIG